jgi:DNA replication and repair protein RecF
MPPQGYTAGIKINIHQLCYLAHMPVFSKITITQFKNYDFAAFNFTERVIGICGLNGQGKTNLLDAIYYLCFTKSYFTRNDVLNVQAGKEGFRLEAHVSSKEGENNGHKIVCIHRGTGKKEFYVDDVLYTKLSGHIGKFPAVMIAPDDVELITGASEERRRFIDTLLSQTDPTYLQQLIVYNKVLQQRNSLLKRFADTGNTDWPLLETIDEQLITPGIYIHQKRKALAAVLIPLTNKFYQQIAGKEEGVTLQYESLLNTMDFYALLNQCRQKDFVLQRSNGGVHKDDIALELDGQPFKSTASQGQRKSLLFALKLAEFEILKTAKGEAPLLLLDDVFEKLDDNRMQQLLHWVCNKNTGQVFITDTHSSRLQQALLSLNTTFQLVELSFL